MGSHRPLLGEQATRGQGALNGAAVLITKGGREIPIRYVAGLCDSRDDGVYLSVSEAIPADRL